MRKKSKKILDKKTYKYVVYGFAIFGILLFILLSQKIRVAIIIAAFIVLNRLINTYKMLIRFPIELEFLSLGIVIVSMNFGLKAGLIIAIFGCITSFIIGFGFSSFSLPMFLGYSSIAVVSFLLKNYDLTFVGIFATLINNFIVFTLYHYLFGYSITRNIGFSISNIIINSIIFANIAPLIVSLI